MCDLTEYLSDYILKDKKSSDEAAENIVYDFFHNLYHKYKATDLAEQDYKKVCADVKDVLELKRRIDSIIE